MYYNSNILSIDLAGRHVSIIALISMHKYMKHGLQWTYSFEVIFRSDKKAQ